MKSRRMIVLIVAMMLGGLVSAMGAALNGDQAPVQSRANESIRFMPVHVWVDSGNEPLAAYQIEIAAREGDVKIVGIEGGEHEAYRDPPYYDPQAMQRERVIIADFSTASSDELPTGRTRIATIHMQVSGEVQPSFQSTIDTAATVGGRSISITINTGMEDQ